MSKKIFRNFLAFIILTGSFLLTSSVLAQGFGTNEVANGLGGSLAATDPRTVAGRVINIILGFLGVIAVGLISYAGFMWMTADGDEEKIGTAKKILKNGIIGLIIILASWGIALFILSKLGEATGGTNGGNCYDGETHSCGCGGTGTMICSGGTWSGCIGADPAACGGGGEPTTCDGNPNLSGCQAVDQICSTEKYCDRNDCGCKPKGNLGDPCSSSPDLGVCTPDNNRCSDYLTCNPQTCTCYGPPVITEMSPVGGFCEENINKSCLKDSDCSTSCNLTNPNGATNNFITIIGRNFGNYSPTSSKVVFAASTTPISGREPSSLNVACINTWRDDQIVIAVPTGNTTGPVGVVNSDGLTDTTSNGYGPKIPDFKANNIARPGLCYLDPNRGALSSAVGYQGINLYSGKAYFGNYQNNVSALSSQFDNRAGLFGTSTTPNIRSGDSGSFVQNSINGHQEKSNFLRFTKEPEPGAGPFISSFYPTRGNAGQYVTIRGDGFGGARGTSQVYFGSTPASYDFPDMCLNSVWENNQVIVKVPASLVDGYQNIKMVIGSTTIDTKKLNPPAFEFDKNLDLKSSLCKIEPKRGPATTPVELWGEYFGLVGGEGLVKFNYDKSATGTIKKDGRADTIKTSVPAGAITGPVRVINNSSWGNELNFSVGECTADSDCGTQICCPGNTYKAGRCANVLADCFINIPTSVFEWSFNTSFSTSTNPFNYSCAGLANYYGSCQTGKTCPNVPGSCSPYAGGIKKIVADCNYNCSSLAGCGLLGAQCHYDKTLDKCVQDEAVGVCDLKKTITYTIGGKEYQSLASCNKDKHWEITLSTSCPTGWTKSPNDKCINLNSTCSICPSDLSCEQVSSVNKGGRCVSPKICPSGATCEENFKEGKDKCVVVDQPTCDCCCTIGQSERDCCAPLRCEGTCGSDSGKTNGATLGKCGGCATAGNTPEARDAACNCVGHSGQFCEIGNPQFPDGVCTDCSNLNGTDCTDHSSACCLDSRKTATTTDDICRGGNGRLLTNDPTDLDRYGYCAYYNCAYTTSGFPTTCASTTPVKIGNYASISSCVNDCANVDPCLGITDITECQKHSNCCFDAMIASSTKCRLGTKIEGEASKGGFSDNGYCAYYNCAYTTSGFPTECASTTPVTTGAFKDINRCIKDCANPPSGPGLSCAGAATSTCDTSQCNFEGFGCFSPDGLLGVVAPGCGTCCCQPNLPPNQDACTISNPKLKCIADKGSCSNPSNPGKRGLCCGCSNDNECGSSVNIGCGLDTCCQARPEIASTSPAHLSDKVCRNAKIKINFNSAMDISSFSNNVLLLEERNYGNGVCPAGSFVASGDSIQDILAHKNKNWLARLWERLGASFTSLSGRFSGQALADIPDNSKLYCAVSGTAAGENNGSSTSLIFSPQKILSAGSSYYLIIKGDENLNSKTGVLSAAKIGFNGKGYGNDANLSSYTEGINIKFNNRSYVESQIIKFATLSDQGPTAGICAIDHVSISPASYLFKTTTNGLNENDSEANSGTFDTVSDRDKVFTASAYSSDNQLLQPVTGYFWNWDFVINNPSIAAISPVSNLLKNRTFITAQSGVTDGETRVTAKINMSNFSAGCTTGNCSCQGANCDNHCCNADFGGDGFNQASNLYVFLCNNPWPPVGSNGEWSPWMDNCQGSVGGICENYNYKFYYCRDNGLVGTLDDLPAIIDQAVTRGNGSNLVCSADRTPCPNGSVSNTTKCGEDKNGDGASDGLCIWDVLKESYFFRQSIPSGGEITNATDLRTGGAVKVEWRSESATVDSYKVYYLKSGKGEMLKKEVKANTACTIVGAINNCSAVISSLSNKVPYVFKVSAISTTKTESELSNEKTITPTDQTPPAIPVGFHQPTVSGGSFNFSWSANTDDTSFYRLYHGILPGKYGESFDSVKGAVNLSLSLDQFPVVDNYFALSAVDASGNESAKTTGVYTIKPPKTLNNQ